MTLWYVEVYRRAPCQEYCRELEQAEAKARQDRAGMWIQGDKYENSADFRWRLRIRGD